MVALFIEGFDKFGPTNIVSANVAAALAAGEWTSFGSSTYNIVAGLSATGNALSISYNQNLATGLKTLAASYSRLIGGIRFSSNLANSAACGVGFGDSGTQQCTITINTAGTISLRTGNANGTALATGGSISANSTHYLEWDITFGATASYQVWLDGVSLFSGTGATKTSGNSSANQFNFIGNTGGQTITYDDLYLFDTTGSQNNAVLLTSPRVETQFPNADSSVQFGFGAAILGSASQRVSNTSTPLANRLFLRSFTPAQAGVLQSVACIPGASSGAANYKAVAYSDNSGAPNSLLSSGSQVTGTTNGTTLTSALVTPQTLSAGTAYWIGFITDTSVQLQEVDSTTTGAFASNTYASGAPGTAPTMTTGQPSWIIYGNLTGVGVNNYEEAIPSNQNQAVGDLSYVFDSTSGHEDLYNFPALSVTPSSIYTVAVKGYAKRSDSGARTISLRMKSSGTDSGGTNTGQTPGTSYGWLDTLFDTDPNTSAAWTPGNLNAATSGFKIDS
jgi:hypothetical protein